MLRKEFEGLDVGDEERLKSCVSYHDKLLRYGFYIASVTARRNCLFFAGCSSGFATFFPGSFWGSSIRILLIFACRCISERWSGKR